VANWVPIGTQLAPNWGANGSPMATQLGAKMAKNGFLIGNNWLTKHPIQSNQIQIFFPYIYAMVVIKFG